MRARSVLLALSLSLFAAIVSAGDVKDGPKLPAAPPLLPRAEAPQALPPAPAAAPSVAGPVGTDVPVAQAAGTAAAPVASAASAAAPHLEAVSRPDSSPEAASRAGEGAAAALQGGPPTPRAVDGVWAYGLSRLYLRYLDRGWGVRLSLPRGGRRIERHVLEQAARKKAAISDFDDTFAKYRGHPSGAMGAVMSSLRAAGKRLVINTERPALPLSKDTSLVESLSTVPPADRAGTIGAGKTDGLIFRYDERGEPQVVFKEPEFTADEDARLGRAIVAFKAGLAGLGAELHDGSRDIPAERQTGYSKSIMLKAGTPQDVLLAARDALQAAVKDEKLDYEVEARFAKDSKNPPYVFVSRMDKSWPLIPIMKWFGYTRDDVVVLGDSMYYPKSRTHHGVKGVIARLLTRFGLRLNGGIPLGATGNATDRDMERAVPGALTLSVGGSADPGLRRGYVLPGLGPEQTQRVLEALASGRAPALPPSPVEGRLSYDLRRLALSAIASLWGISPSLPPAGPRLETELLAEVSGKDAVFTDVDNTITDNSQPMSAEMAARLVAIRRAGKRLAFITDRMVLRPGPKDVSVLNSLAPIPAEDRRGMVVGSRTEGTIVEFDAKGEPSVLWEEKPFPSEEKLLIQKAADAVVARFPELGVEMVRENWQPLAYGLILKVGTPEAKVVEVARLFQRELEQRGVVREAIPRMARNAWQEPYVNLYKFDKAQLVRRIAERWDVYPGESLVIGDGLYAPARGGASRWAAWVRRLVEAIAGNPIPLTGNATDRDMEKGVPGALTLSVGGTADPGMRRAYVLPGKGPEETLKVMASVASGRAGARGRGPSAESLLLVLFLAAVAAVFILFMWSFTGLVGALNDLLRSFRGNPPDFP